jgi:predicted phosphoribosyltransferase
VARYQLASGEPSTSVLVTDLVADASSVVRMAGHLGALGAERITLAAPTRVRAALEVVLPYVDGAVCLVTGASVETAAGCYADDAAVPTREVRRLMDLAALRRAATCREGSDVGAAVA